MLFSPVISQIESTGELSGNVKRDRRATRDALAKIKDFDGITGAMTFSEDSDPSKCAVIVRINDSGEFEFYKFVGP
jgi:branched-chain amino acid transport system substrate-binding protein